MGPTSSPVNVTGPSSSLTIIPSTTIIGTDSCPDLCGEAPWKTSCLSDMCLSCGTCPTVRSEVKQSCPSLCELRLDLISIEEKCESKDCALCDSCKELYDESSDDGSSDEESSDDGSSDDEEFCVPFLCDLFSDDITCRNPLCKDCERCDDVDVNKECPILCDIFDATISCR